MSVISDLNRITCQGAFALLRRKHVQGWHGVRVQEMFRKDDLAAKRRWARNELGVPVPNHRAHLNHRRRRSGLYQHHHRSHHRDRRRGMHRNAQRAMIGILVLRMHMRHLDHGQQRQQNQTHYGRNRQSA